MAANLPTHLEPILKDFNIERFRSKAHQEHNFNQDDIEDAYEYIAGTDSSKIHPDGDKIAINVKNSQKYSKAGFISSFNGKAVVWGTNPTEELEFLVVDASDASKVLKKFRYNVSSFIKTYTQAFMGSCRPNLRSTVNMGFYASQDTVLLMGPAEEERFTAAGDYARRNGCYLITATSPFVQEFAVELPAPYNKDGAGWPAAFAMDPRSDHPNEALMICSTGCASLEFGVGDSLGYPVRYNIQTKKVLALFTGKLLFGKLLQFLKGGQQVACLEHEDFDENYKKKPQKIWVFEADSLTPLFTVEHTNLDECITLLYSADWQHLALMTAGYELGEYKNRVNLFKCPQAEGDSSKTQDRWSANNKCIPFQVDLCRKY